MNSAVKSTEVEGYLEEGFWDAGGQRSELV